jgi:hypothetical protein
MQMPPLTESNGVRSLENKNMEKIMLATPRFYLNKDRLIVDRVNRQNSLNFRVYEGMPEDERALCCKVLWRNVQQKFDDLLRPAGKSKKYSYCYKEPVFEAARTVYGLLEAVGAARRHQRTVSSPMSRAFSVGFKKEERGIQHITTFGLFAAELQRILWDLNGEFDEATTLSVHDAILRVARSSTRSKPRELWQEYEAAKDYDYIWYGIGQYAAGYPPSKTEVGAAIEAAEYIAGRARAVRSSPHKFCKYTLQFVKILDNRWPGVKTFKPKADFREYESKKPFCI